MNSQDTPPIIIIRKKVAHAGHHGGAWKVAYADFVTAMMALLIVVCFSRMPQPAFRP
jgi:chemotaxis protein MotB